MRLTVFAYALAAVLGVDLVVCIDTSGHTAIEFGASACCSGPGPAHSEDAPPKGVGSESDDDCCGPCFDRELIPDTGVQFRAPALLSLLALAAGPAVVVDRVRPRLERWAIVRSSLPPPEDGRRGIVLRC